MELIHPAGSRSRHPPARTRRLTDPARARTPPSSIRCALNPLVGLHKRRHPHLRAILQEFEGVVQHGEMSNLRAWSFAPFSLCLPSLLSFADFLPSPQSSSGPPTQAAQDARKRALRRAWTGGGTDPQYCTFFFGPFPSVLCPNCPSLPFLRLSLDSPAVPLALRFLFPSIPRIVLCIARKN